MYAWQPRYRHQPFILSDSATPYEATEDGPPKLNEDGSITLRSNENSVNGMWFRTKKLTSPCPKEYTVFAFDYKSNRVVSDVVLFPQEGYGNWAQIQKGSAAYTVAENYQTLYIVWDRVNSPAAPWGSEAKYAGSYYWVSTNDANGKDPGWELTIKNLRMLTLEEAATECKSQEMTGDIADLLYAPNLDLMADYDAAMESNIYMRNEGVPCLRHPISLTLFPKLQPHSLSTISSWARALLLRFGSQLHL